MRRRWEFWVDRGGTFTDCIGLDPNTDRLHVAKCLSSEFAFLEGIREILQLGPDDAVPPCVLRLGTTLATNALLERRGTSCCLVITQGFKDALEIGDQTRPDLFALDIRRRAPLYRSVVEVSSRGGPAGIAVDALDRQAAFEAMHAAREAGSESVAIVVLFGQHCPALEREIGEVAREAGFNNVSLSHDFAAGAGFVNRGDTTVLDAYLTPTLQTWLAKIGGALPGSNVRLMQSSGGLTSPGRLRGPHAIFSGPAAGVVACRHVARATGHRFAIGFDMGGTSTDVCRVAEELEYEYDSLVASVRVHSPTLRVHTVAAGGGSVCKLEMGRLSVGPESAGAEPGPLCYGRTDAKALTLTDVNVALGRLVPDRFPFPLDGARASRFLRQLAEESALSGVPLTPDELAAGFLAIANANMAQAIREVSVARGYDVRDHALVVFGGAGGQHACAVAALLGVRTILFHPLAGVLSAFGMGLADNVWHGEAAVSKPFCPENVTSLDASFAELANKGRASLLREGVTAAEISVHPRVDLRYAGTETSLTIPYGSFEAMLLEFEHQHQRLFGYRREGYPIEMAVQRTEVRGTRSPPNHCVVAPTTSATRPVRRTRANMGGQWLDDVPVYHREDLGSDAELPGPALVLEATGTIALDPGFTLRLRSDSIIEVKLASTVRESALRCGSAMGTTSTPDPIRLELIANAVMSIADQMGQVLQRTAVSTNIRERRDFSCAVFDRQGGLVANAPHIPVHLGAMAQTVRALLATRLPLASGDAYVTNDPDAGGSHLPDVTVISPVFGRNSELLFFVANRGHHADVGGSVPGSMPPFSSSLEEEGVLLPLFRVRHGQRFERESLLARLATGPFPARNPAQNIADIEAQMAANNQGELALLTLVEEFGSQVVEQQLKALQADAASRVRAKLRELPEGIHRFADSLDDGTAIIATLTVKGERLTVDFTGTGSQTKNNLNAPFAVTLAATLYVMRVIASGSLPLNSGTLDPVNVIVPRGCLLNPNPGAAIAGGNVETSQRVVDVLLGALKVAAASQGTMNNLAFGDSSFGYYETIAGGAGATATSRGASGVHTHMTNTRITDPEVLESRYPVRVRRFELRHCSGGHGAHPGGDGLVREFEFLAPVTVSLIAERRTTVPFGCNGGQSGKCGEQFLNDEPLGGRARVSVVPGDRLVIATPGGGGWGAPPAAEPAPSPLIPR